MPVLREDAARFLTVVPAHSVATVASRRQAAWVLDTQTGCAPCVKCFSRSSRLANAWPLYLNDPDLGRPPCISSVNLASNSVAPLSASTRQELSNATSSPTKASYSSRKPGIMMFTYLLPQRW